MIEQQPVILRDLGDGLVLRTGARSDADALSEFNARIHSDDGPDQPDERVRAWTRDLLEKPHPTFRPQDFTIVEDARTGAIVSSMNLISQTWSYAGVSFGVGRPELVGTLPEYRNRGLVRIQFEQVHQWSAARGEMLQAITGIPYYYRLFGYEMAMDLGGGQVGYKPLLPKLKDGETEPYRVRPVQETDLALIASLYTQVCQRSLVSCVWDEALWRYELNGKSDQNVNRLALRVIETREGEPVGFLGHPPFNWGAGLVAMEYELKPGISWGAVTPSVARYLYATGEVYAARDGKASDVGSFGFWLGTQHPVYQTLHDALPRVRKPYAFFLRVPDLPAFLRRIAPALEKRLAASPYCGHTGELKITFYRSGLLLGFDTGRLVKVEAWRPAPQGHSGDAAFPDLTFLQLLFGYRSFEELNYAFADCWWDNDQAFGLLNALFAKQPSDMWPVS